MKEERKVYVLTCTIIKNGSTREKVYVSTIGPWEFTVDGIAIPDIEFTTSLTKARLYNYSAEALNDKDSWVEAGIEFYLEKLGEDIEFEENVHVEQITILI